MTKDTFLTVRWNNILSAALGLPGLLLIIVAFSTSAWQGVTGMIGVSIFGVLF